MAEGFILGIIQGITEWLPVSSEGILTLVGIKFFGRDLAGSISMAIFLHMGTFFSALIYFRKDVVKIFRPENKKILRFLVLSSLVTAAVAAPLLFFAMDYFSEISLVFIVAFVGLMLVFTGLAQFKKPETYFRNAFDLKNKDGLVAGVWQGLAVLPGISRSGFTIAVLLLRKFRDSEALRLSFLMSLPVVLGANAVLALKGFTLSLGFGSSVAALLTAFVVGFLTIGALLKISRKINFGWFAIFFGVLTLLSLLV